MARPCQASIYEPGNPHAHACIAGSAHTGTDHTCSCSHTWANTGLTERQQNKRMAIILGAIVAALIAITLGVQAYHNAEVDGKAGCYSSGC